MHRERHAPLEECEWKQGECAVATDSRLKKGPVDLDPPFPFPRWGKAGAGGFPPRRQNQAAPPTRGASPPCAIPQGRFQLSSLTSAGLLMEAASEANQSGERSDP